MRKITLTWPALPNTLFDLYRTDAPILSTKRLPIPYMTGLTDQYVDTDIVAFKKYYYTLGYKSNDNTYVILQSVEIIAFKANIFYNFKSFELDVSNGQAVDTISNTRLDINGAKVINGVTPLSTGYAYFGGNTTQGNPYVAANIVALGVNDFTAEAWIAANYNRTDSFGHILQVGGSTGPAIALCKYSNEADAFRLCIRIRTTTTWSHVGDITDVSIPEYEMTHVALIRKNGILYVAVNGAPVIMHFDHPNLDIPAGQFIIGALTTNTNKFVGVMDSARLINTSVYNVAGFIPPNIFLNTDITQQSNILASIRFNANEAYDDSPLDLTLTTGVPLALYTFDNTPRLHTHKEHRLYVTSIKKIGTGDFTLEVKIKNIFYHSAISNRIIQIGGDQGEIGGFLLFFSGLNTLEVCNIYGRGTYIYGGVRQYGQANSHKELDIVVMRKGTDIYWWVNNVFVRKIQNMGYNFEGTNISVLTSPTHLEYCTAFISKMNLTNAALYAVNDDSILDELPEFKHILINKSCEIDGLNVDISYEFDDLNEGTSYRIYRSASPIDLHINKGDIIAEGDFTTYTDTDIQTNKCYYYAVATFIGEYEISYDYLGYVITPGYTYNFDKTHYMMYIDQTGYLDTYYNYSNIVHAISIPPSLIAVGPLYKNNKGYCNINSTVTNNHGGLTATLDDSIGLDDFTLETALLPYLTGMSNLAHIFKIGNSLSLHKVANTNELIISYSYTGTSGSTTPKLSYIMMDKTYFNICLMRKDGIFYVFVDGKKVLTVSNIQDLELSNILHIFNAGDQTNGFNGYADSVKFTRYALYDIDGYAEPTGYSIYDEHFDKTELYIDFYNESDIQRNTVINDLSTYNTPVTRYGYLYTYKTSDTSYGWLQLYGSDYLNISDITFGSSDYMVEFNTIPSVNEITTDSTTILQIGSTNYSKNFQLRIFKGYFTFILLTVTNGSWSWRYTNIKAEHRQYNICIQRYKGHHFLFIDGKLVASTVLDADVNVAHVGTAFNMGYDYSLAERYKGLVSDVKVTVGAADKPLQGYDVINERLTMYSIRSTKPYAIDGFYDTTSESVKLKIDFQYKNNVKDFYIYRYNNTTKILERFSIDVYDEEYEDTNIIANTVYDYYFMVTTYDDIKLRSNTVNIMADEASAMPTGYNKFKLVQSRTYDTNPAGTYTNVLGSASISWNSSEKCLVITGGLSMNFISITDAQFISGDCAFEADFKLTSDPSDRRHFGLFLNTGTSQGYRIVTLDYKLVFSRWEGSQEYNSVSASGTSTVINKKYTFRAERVDNNWYIYINGHKLGPMSTDSAHSLYTNLRMGIFVYGCTVNLYGWRLYRM